MTHNHRKKKSHDALSKFTMLCWTTFIAILGCMRPVHSRLDTPTPQRGTLSPTCGIHTRPMAEAWGWSQRVQEPLDKSQIGSSHHSSWGLSVPPSASRVLFILWQRQFKHLGKTCFSTVYYKYAMILRCFSVFSWLARLKFRDT